ncbi:MAG: zinc ribbon domain-containing protein [Bacteroidales bacterium]|jgi:hypothetical protein|nr:zinc ribbon domain-containing protein [Bacteroidales bacterium]
MHCEKCGKQIKDGSKFCQFCGEKIPNISFHKPSSSVKNDGKFNMDKIIKGSLAISFMIIALSVAYYFVIFIPHKENQIIEQQKIAQQLKEQKEEEEKNKAEEEKKNKATMLNVCLSLAQDNYSAVWASNCKSNASKISTGIANCRESSLSDSDCRSIWGNPDSSSDCSLPLDLAKSIEDSLNKRKDECFKKYPQ